MVPHQYKAVFFDLGGVVFSSPFPFIRQYEEQIGCKPRAIVKLLGGKLFAQLEVDAITFDQFLEQFDQAAKNNGLPSTFSTRELMKRIENNFQMRPYMVEVIRTLKRHGFTTAAITNNWNRPMQDGFSRRNISSFLSNMYQLFDLVLESRVLKIRKPDPRIFKLALSKLKLEPEECIFLDDVGRNLKAAKNLGIGMMKFVVSLYWAMLETILVNNPMGAILELEKLTSVDLVHLVPLDSKL